MTYRSWPRLTSRSLALEPRSSTRSSITTCRCISRRCTSIGCALAMSGSCASCLRSQPPPMCEHWSARLSLRRLGSWWGARWHKREKLSLIWEAAQTSAALPHHPDSLAVETFRITLRRYSELNELRTEIEQRAEQALAGNPDFEHLRTLPGIGPIIALTILAEGGDLRRFAHHRQFLKYCG